MIDAMDAWKYESQFGDFIAESSTFPTAPPSPSPDHRPSQPRDEDIEAFRKTLEQVQRVEAHLRRQKEDTTQIQHLLGFLKGSRKISPALSIAGQYERLQPLRTWLFWMPVGFLQKQLGSPNSLIIIAHLYSITLLMERLFPEIGAAYFGSLSIAPVEAIARRLMSMSAAGGPESDSRQQTPLTLMEFPIDMVNQFRSRMGWVQPERTPSFPQFHPPNFPLDGQEMVLATAEQQQQQHQQAYLPYDSVTFSYSTEEMSTLSSDAGQGHHQASVSPLMLSPAFPSHQYLNIPSPSYGCGDYSPALSTLDGSVAHSDTEDYGSLDLGGAAAAATAATAAVYFPSGQPPMFGEAHRNYGVGFVTPHQPVWI